MVNKSDIGRKLGLPTKGKTTRQAKKQATKLSRADPYKHASAAMFGARTSEEKKHARGLRKIEKKKKS